MLVEMYQRTPKDPSALCQRVADLPTHPVIFTSQVDLEDKDGLTPLMHGLLAVRSSMDSESAVRAVSVLAQHSKAGSLQRQEDGGWGHCFSRVVVGAFSKLVVDFQGNAALYDALLDALLAKRTPCSRKFGRRTWKQWSRAGLPAAPS